MNDKNVALIMGKLTTIELLLCTVLFNQAQGNMFLRTVWCIGIVMSFAEMLVYLIGGRS